MVVGAFVTMVAMVAMVAMAVAVVVVVVVYLSRPIPGLPVRVAVVAADE